MPKEYTDPQDVLNDMLPILNSCAKRKNYIDGIVVVLRSTILAESQVPDRHFDRSVVASLLANLTQTTKDTFGEDTNLEYVCFQTQQAGDNQLWAWTIVYPYEEYKLVFAGKLDERKNLEVHQATVPSYVEQLLPLIKARHDLT